MNKFSIAKNSLIAVALSLATVACSGSEPYSDGDDASSSQDESYGDGSESETGSDTEAGVVDEIVEIDVVIGQTSGSAIPFQATLGQTVRITLLNPDADDEFHLHGYDLGGDVTPAGQEEVFEFTADKLGTFELESHVTGDWILTLVVEEP